MKSIFFYTFDYPIQKFSHQLNVELLANFIVSIRNLFKTCNAFFNLGLFSFESKNGFTIIREKSGIYNRFF